MPYGLLAPFREAEPREPPPPRAVFTSNPLRGLDWLLDLWAARIAPEVPGAELHIYCGPAVYGADGDKAQRMEAVLARIEALYDSGVRAPSAGPARGIGRQCWPGRGSCCIAAIRARPSARRWPRRNRSGCRSSCSRSGMVAERVVDGVTGIVAADDAAFAAAAIRLLRDDDTWRRFHQEALARQRGLSWDEVASRYEALIG